MTPTTHVDHSTSCAISSGGECTCGGECTSRRATVDLPSTLRDAAAVGCTITVDEAQDQLARVDSLRPHVLRSERRKGFLAVTFDSHADAAALDRFVEFERGCCSFLEITQRQTDSETRVAFSTTDHNREPALGAIARMFDPAGPVTSHDGTEPRQSPRNKTLLAILGVACLACLLPAVLAAGAAASIAAALSGASPTAIFLAGLLIAVLIAAVAIRRSRSRACGCQLCRSARTAG